MKLVRGNGTEHTNKQIIEQVVTISDQLVDKFRDTYKKGNCKQQTMSHNKELQSYKQQTTY